MSSRCLGICQVLRYRSALSVSSFRQFRNGLVRCSKRLAGRRDTARECLVVQLRMRVRGWIRR